MEKELKIDEYIFLKKWKKEQRKILQVNHPTFSKKEINEFLDDIIKEKMKNKSCEIHNNYIHKVIKLSLLELINWMETTKPICGGYGVFYKNQHQIFNPLAQMINKFLKSRKTFKDMLKVLAVGSYEYITSDRKQLSEKIMANSIYGTFGNAISFLFNIYTAPSVTATGQSLISTTEQAFEAFMTNNVLFNDVNECITFINNIVSEKTEIDGYFIPNVPIEKVFTRLVDMFYDYDEKYDDIIYNYLSSLSKDKLNRIYYKNNLYEFSSLYTIQTILSEILHITKEFKNPNKTPDESADLLDVLWSYYKEFVMYKHSPINRIQRLKNEPRKCVLTIDTDSNMLNVNPWVDYIFNSFIEGDTVLENRNESEMTFIAINTIAFILTKMVTEVLQNYTEIANVPEDYRGLIGMKNEFLFTIMVLASVKKRYIASIRLKEGREIYPEKLEIKGHDFIKSSSTEDTRSFYEAIIREKILRPGTPDLKGILNDLETLEDRVVTSLKKGEKSYLTPSSVKEEVAYKDAMREQGFRAVCNWNYLYPDMQLELPVKVDLVKLKLSTEEAAHRIKKYDADMYENVMKNIFNNKNEKIREKGLGVIAIPRNIDKIPEWMIPFIEVETITVDVLKKFYPVLNSLGFETVKTSNSEYFSNIINV